MLHPTLSTLENPLLLSRHACPAGSLILGSRLSTTSTPVSSHSSLLLVFSFSCIGSPVALFFSFHLISSITSITSHYISSPHTSDAPWQSFRTGWPTSWVIIP